MAFKNTLTNKKVLQYGFALGLVYIFLKIISHRLALSSELSSLINPIYYTLFIAVIFRAIFLYRKQNDDQLQLKEAIHTGLCIALISGVLIAAYIMIHRYFIDPTQVEKILAEVREKYAQDPDMSEKMSRQLMQGVKIGVQPWFHALIWVILSGFFGFLYALIAGFLLKKNVA